MTINYSILLNHLFMFFISFTSGKPLWEPDNLMWSELGQVVEGGQIKPSLRQAPAQLTSGISVSDGLVTNRRSDSDFSASLSGAGSSRSSHPDQQLAITTPNFACNNQADLRRPLFPFRPLGPIELHRLEGGEWGHPDSSITINADSSLFPFAGSPTSTHLYQTNRAESKDESFVSSSHLLGSLPPSPSKGRKVGKRTNGRNPPVFSDLLVRAERSHDQSTSALTKSEIPNLWAPQPETAIMNTAFCNTIHDVYRSFTNQKGARVYNDKKHIKLYLGINKASKPESIVISNRSKTHSVYYTLHDPVAGLYVWERTLNPLCEESVVLHPMLGEGLLYAKGGEQKRVDPYRRKS
ncbi:hypothetical protein PGT21_036692 [Puccinia graminis f. sp. tritici]|uniref:Uncharacterized protein n=2 Tax=Puccinia graminis f. sp. tritici TaxID=56615 RepID=E3JQ21_PUCGT|nr:uncharacterized protein PGTG_00060 [Puccinia graminis f. sp. tritici CRL 75-36-700-3]EFP74104.2 hypothetical protein PGTG_00060 [Puccinia graminis f. sp. tritici CRL 75-36-700-3]KAA1115457.1 hypothetical protein PGT21_036692 [Puccinia graminis f. sp. tritici]KAA1121934.1 hypothetical protein PGTUg99_035721 [Puccinia graminis f. sp. tritici]